MTLNVFDYYCSIDQMYIKEHIRLLYILDVKRFIYFYLVVTSVLLDILHNFVTQGINGYTMNTCTGK